jgi:hypothetical protein
MIVAQPQWAVGIAEHDVNARLAGRPDDVGLAVRAR